MGKSAQVDRLINASLDRRLNVSTGRAWEVAVAPPGFALEALSPGNVSFHHVLRKSSGRRRYGRSCQC